MPLVDAHVGQFDDDTEREAVDAILAATLAGRIPPGPIARLQLSAIVAAFLGGPHSVPRACVGNPTVRAALGVIDRDYATLQGPSDVARMVGKSLSYVTDLLRDQTGYPMATWLREKRLFAASLLLAGRTPSIIDVALAVGYCDSGHFARQFVRRFGVTPSAWRSQRGERFVRRWRIGAWVKADRRSAVSSPSIPVRSKSSLTEGDGGQRHRQASAARSRFDRRVRARGRRASRSRRARRPRSGAVRTHSKITRGGKSNSSGRCRPARSARTDDVRLRPERRARRRALVGR
jgi:AraC-like DNA-binding protein